MGWVLKRIAVALFLVWVTTTVVFSMIYLVPGDPAELLLSQSGAAPNPATVAALRQKLGLDLPFLTQYWNALTGILRGDLGRSLQDGASVGTQIMLRLPRTLELIAAAGLIAVAVGIPLGVVVALRPGGKTDRLFSALSALGLSVPVFVVGTLIVYVMAQKLQLVGAGAFVALTVDPARHLLLLLLPASAAAINLTATVFRMSRASVIDVLDRDFVRTARAKGIGEARLLLHHVVRNALTPVVTVLALNLGAMLGGTVLVEYVFNWPGLSGLLVSAVNARDYPMVVGVILVISIIFIFLNLIVDLLYGVIDPRVRDR